MIFRDRQDGGEQLANKLKPRYKHLKDLVILGLPRGGMVTAREVAAALKKPLDIVAPRKISAPGNSEFAIGAITEDGEGVFDEDLIERYRISQSYIDEEIKKEKAEARRRLELYRAGREPLSIKDKIAVLVDDGIATGATMQAAIKYIKKQDPKEIWVAVPVSARASYKKIRKEIDKVLYLHAPFYFGAVGAFYENFPQTEDEEVIKIMEEFKN